MSLLFILISIVITIPIIKTNHSYNYNLANPIRYVFSENIPKFAQFRRRFYGMPTEVTEFPYLGIIISEGPTCSGVIIKAQWLLTCSHCITRRIKYVAYKYDTIEEVRATIDKSIKHPYFYLREDHTMVIELHHDVGLVHYNDTFRLKLSEDTLPLSFSFSNSRNLVEYEMTSFSYGVFHDYPKRGVIWKRNITLTDCLDVKNRKFICGNIVNPNGPGRSCPGDSGGALVIERFILIAINSLSPASCLSDAYGFAPSMFVDLYEYLPWIESIVSLDESELFAASACLRNDKYFLVVALLLSFSLNIINTI